MILSEYEALQSYDQMLDEVYPELFIGHSSFLPSTVLKELDPIAYRVGFGEYVDSLAEAGEFVEGYTDDLEESVDESMDGVRMTPQDPSKKNYFFRLSYLDRVDLSVWMIRVSTFRWMGAPIQTHPSGLIQ
jgi:hypothetical protein